MIGLRKELLWKYVYESLGSPVFLLMKTILIPDLFHFASFFFSFASWCLVWDHLFFSFGQHISSLQSSEFSFSMSCLYTTESTKNKSRNLLTSGLQEQ